MKAFWLGLLVLLTLCLASCGYHVGGRADLVPKSIKTIAVPSFSSQSNDYQLADILPNAISHEFIERTRFHVVAERSEADAILQGTINRVIHAPALSDPVTGKTTSVQLIVIMSLQLVERSSGKLLYSRPNLTVRENFELATDPHQIFDESGPAFARMSREVARDVVTSVTENF